MKTKIKRLPEAFKRVRILFWIAYVAGFSIYFLIFLLILMVCVNFSISEMADLTVTMKPSNLWDLYIMGLFVLVIHVPVFGYYYSVCFSQKQCMEKYEKMCEEEKRQIDYWYSRIRHMRLGDIVYTQNYFMHRDKKRFLLPYIHTYDEVIWAYLAVSFYSGNQPMPGNLSLGRDVTLHTIVFQVADGRKYSILQGNDKTFLTCLPKDIIIGYGREQKRLAKDYLIKMEMYDPSLVEIKRNYRRKFIITAVVIVLVLAIAAAPALFRFFIPEKDSQKGAAIYELCIPCSFL